MANSMETFEDMTALVQKQIPQMEIRFKNESRLMKVLGVLLWVFNPKFMTDYVTTLYPHVYYPSREFLEKDPWVSTKILAHEFVHLWDRKRDGPWFSVSYLLPQLFTTIPVLALVVVAFFSFPYKMWVMVGLGVLALACLAPWPSIGRTTIELRGYTVSLGVNYWRYGNLTQRNKDWIALQFTGWPYYKMWPFKKGMARKMDDIEQQLLKNHLDWPFSEIKRFVTTHK